MTTNHVAQLRLFHSEAEVERAQVESQNLTREEIWDRFKAEFDSARLYPGSHCLVEFPQTEGIAEMGRQQVRRYPSSMRFRADCDRVSMLGKAAWSRFLGEPADKVFDDWTAALGAGNKGVFWRLPGEYVGLRTTSGQKSKFIYSRNRYTDRLTAMAFARVQVQHTGAAYVELLGWAHRHRIAAFIKDRGQFYELNLDRIQACGLLLSPDDFRQRYIDAHNTPERMVTP